MYRIILLKVLYSRYIPSHLKNNNKIFTHFTIVDFVIAGLMLIPILSS